MTALKSYSGITLSQNKTPTDKIALDNTYKFQEFFLPSDYQRGKTSSEWKRPEITGFQIMVSVDLEQLSSAQLQWQIGRYQLGQGWDTLETGSTIGAHAAGDQLWFDVYLDEPIVISEDDLGEKFRIGFKSPTGVTYAWYTAPSPLTTQAYTSDGTTALLGSISFNFRLLGSSADDGIDPLGNLYRSAVIRSKATDADSVGEVQDVNQFWMSKPNPSKFAVECLYFDLSEGGPSTVDRILLDPITPGCFFHVYFTDEGDPEIEDDAWDQKLWKRVPQSFRMDRRQEVMLPEPITARYFKLEFSHLQAHAYDPGPMAVATPYKKHPKWVLDYFLARLTFSQSEDPYIADNINVIYNSLDIAYNYYLDDLRQEPLNPLQLVPAVGETVSDFMKNRSDASDEVDANTLAQIKLIMQPYTTAAQGKANYLPTIYGPPTSTNLQLEGDPNHASAQVGFVSSTDRNQVLMEQQWPIMFFFLTARHAYRELSAPFAYHRAYFVGIREIAFLRDRYFIPHDATSYIETGGDSSNVRHSDLVRVDDTWAPYATD